MYNWKRYMLYATNVDPQILVMWTRSSSNVAKYLSDTITNRISIFISHDPIEECSKNYIWEWNMLEAWEIIGSKKNENGANNYDDHFEEALLET